MDVDLLAGVDEAWSEVRKFILRLRNEVTAMKKWVPDFMGATGYYGIWPDQGNLSTSPLPNRNLRWDLVILEEEALHYSATVRKGHLNSNAESGWEHGIAPGTFPHNESVQILRRHGGIYHPVTGTFGRILATSEKIIRSPLRQHIWEDEILYGNVAVIGDAARLMLPSSGQGSSFAIEDATALANSLLNLPPASSDKVDFRPPLEEYACLRIPRSKRMAQMTYYAS